MQSGVTNYMGLYTRVLVPIYDSCFALGSKLFSIKDTNSARSSIVHFGFQSNIICCEQWKKKTFGILTTNIPSHCLVFYVFWSTTHLPSSGVAQLWLWKWQLDIERNKKRHQWTDTPGQTLTEQRTRTKWVYLSEMVMISIDFNVIYL